MNSSFRRKPLVSNNPDETSREVRIVAFSMTIILIFLIILSGCSASGAAGSNLKTLTATVETTSQNNLVLLQKNLGCSGRLYGSMTFKAFEQDFTYPTEFKLPPMAITWMGPIFNGRLQTKGQGASIYEVHGGASEDGNWIETMYFSVNTFQPNSQYGLFYRVTLRNLHLKVDNVNSSGTFIFEMTGAEVQKYITDIEYYGTSQYVSTDWQTQDQGLLPSLKVEFIKEAPAAPSGGGGGGGM